LNIQRAVYSSVVQTIGTATAALLLDGQAAEIYSVASYVSRPHEITTYPLQNMTQPTVITNKMHPSQDARQHTPCSAVQQRVSTHNTVGITEPTSGVQRATNQLHVIVILCRRQAASTLFEHKYNAITEQWFSTIIVAYKTQPAVWQHKAWQVV